MHKNTFMMNLCRRQQFNVLGFSYKVRKPLYDFNPYPANVENMVSS
jgi:hypothetical protein